MSVINAIVAQMIISVVMENAYLSVKFVLLAKLLEEVLVRYYNFQIMVVQKNKNFVVSIPI